MKKILVFAVVVLLLNSSCQQKRAPQLTSADIGKVINQMTELMIHDITNPPLAARFFSYACLAGYEVVSENNTAFKSMHGIVRDYPAIARPDSIKGYSSQLAAVLAMIETAKKLQPSGSLLNKYEQTFLDSCKNIGFNDETVEQSLRYAQVISRSILQYAKADAYNKLSNLPRYTPINKEGCWYPTPPAYIAAIEPYFSRVRPFLLDSAGQFRVAPPTPFSKDKNSAFYKLMYANYQQAEDSLSEENRHIAAFWDCNPFAVQDQGHLMIGLKKISPGAHWLGITNIVCGQTGKSFEETLFIHTVVAMGLMDSFMACWDEKYRSNRIRPETAIRQLIDVRWKPLLQTPPFPEYLSGHSCISTTSATILSHYFGEHVGFTDTVEVRYGLPPRHFNSFNQAAEEAAISRFYGGIHFMDAITEGVEQGKKVGEWVIGKMDKANVDGALAERGK
ncbi:vanadium-dependent haloperoxidase [Ilyomonas limi]|uniref:Vanadium-dependent haloperoxidase n=1 Tax=Ilyomonas limi TaxID=2575867 RepID=A0A4U3L2X8_9BACT|nr:vanadium-dependent haloperoxidase [Ilyomonas limi]TKK68604.1 vanadium-dependent haloperoxidase [Ilyomonas limi]